MDKKSALNKSPILIHSAFGKNHTEDGFISLYSFSELQDRHTHLGALMKHATTIWAYSADNKLKITDSEVFTDKERPSCEKFREEFKCKDKCHEIDKKHAEILLSGLKFKTRKDIEDMFKNPDESNDWRIKQVAESENTSSRYYLEYNCPFLGYLECIFPIFVKDIIVAVMFIGQLRTRNSPLIRDCLEKCLKEDENFFPGIKENSCIINDIVESEKNTDKNTNPYNLVNFNNEESLRGFFGHINKILCDFEESLEMRLNQRHQESVKIYFDNKKSYIFNKLQENNVEDKIKKLESFWTIIKTETNKIFEEIGIGNVQIFGNEVYDDQTVEEKLELPLIQSSKNQDLNKNVKLDYNGMKKILYPKVISNIENLNFYEDKIQNCDRVLVWPAYNGNCCVLFRITNPDINWENPLVKFVIDNILNLYSILFAQFQSIWSLISKEKVVEQKKINEIAFSTFSHEISQHTSALTLLYCNNFEKKQIYNLSEETYNKVRGDFFSSCESLDYLAKNAKVYTGKIIPDKTDFWVFGEKIFKFINIFKSEVGVKGMYICTPSYLYEGDSLRSQIYTDKNLFEQILFNLLRNAFQYSHPNTNINVDCKKDNSYSNSPHKLTVTNFGIELDKSIDLYKMNVRGTKAKEFFGRGSGIGLYVVKSIINALGGEISSDGGTCYSEEFNIPLIDDYLYYAKKTNDDRFNIADRLKALKEDKNIPFDEVINKKNITKRFSKSFVYDRILYDTWKTTFTVTFPAKGV